LSNDRARAANRAAPLQQLELELRRDIAEAFFTAHTPIEVYRLALTRVTPLVNASFASVFLRDEAEPDLLRLVCAHNWPQTSARHLSQLRIRVGRGPTGRAVAERVATEVVDIFADISLRDWWEPARELGFVSLISLPLIVADVVIGAVSFYYAAPHDFSDDERSLMSLIAEQLSLTSDRAARQEELRQTVDTLHAEVAALSARVGEAEEVQRLKTEFLANISHELRTPLTSILGHTYLLLEQHAGPLNEAQAAALRRIDKSGTMLLGLINELLALTELKLGRVEVIIAPVDALLLARRAAEIVPAPAPDKVGFRIECAESRIPVHTDAEKVVKILENLLSNAFKFTRDGEVVLGVRRQGIGSMPRVEWSVRDTGIGIPAEQLGAIFDEFRQVDGSSTRLYGGSGLGLSLSLQLARLLGGELLVESKPGEGSTFTLRIPVDTGQTYRLDAI
jgi:signal transduction histidine kinase